MVVLGIISLISTIIGIYYVSEKKAVGFLLYTISLACQYKIFLDQENWFLVFQMLLLIALNLYTYFKWMRE